MKVKPSKFLPVNFNVNLIIVSAVGYLYKMLSGLIYNKTYFIKSSYVLCVESGMKSKYLKIVLIVLEYVAFLITVHHINHHNSFSLLDMYL